MFTKIPCWIGTRVELLVSDSYQMSRHTANHSFLPRHPKLAVRFLSQVTFSHSVSVYNFYFSPLCLGILLSLIWQVQSLCTAIPSEVMCPVALHHFSSLAYARTKRLFCAWESCSLKNEIGANRRILTAGRKWCWKWDLPAWQAAGSMHYSLSFNKLFIGFEKWKGPKEEGLYNSFMCIYSELLPSVRVAWTPSVIGFSTILGFDFSGSFLFLAQGCGACIVQRVQQTRLSIGQT